MTVDTHTESRTTPQRGRSVAVWDLPTRLFHWGLVLTVLSTWPSFTYAERLGDPTLRWHRYNGYAILILITFRIIWGFVGSSTARWTSFVRWPWDAARYGIDLLRGANRNLARSITSAHDSDGRPFQLKDPQSYLRPRGSHLAERH